MATVSTSSAGDISLRGFPIATFDGSNPAAYQDWEFQVAQALFQRHEKAPDIFDITVRADRLDREANRFGYTVLSMLTKGSALSIVKHVTVGDARAAILALREEYAKRGLGYVSVLTHNSVSTVL